VFVPLSRKSLAASALACVPVFILAFAPQAAMAAPALDGSTLRWPWALPFAGILLSIATGPLLYPKFWHDHYGKIALGWGGLTLIALALFTDVETSIAVFVHEMLTEYLSFIVLLFALYVVAGGILVTGNLRASPSLNTGILAIGTIMASFVGTTGAAMILIRPLLRANAARLNNVHVVIFFIFLVANIGGALSPLGDPPLFVGFLHGVDFFWTTKNIVFETALVVGLLLAAFFAVDMFFHRRDRRVELIGEESKPMALRVQGLINVLLLALVIAAILVSAVWKPGVTLHVYGTDLELQNIVRDGALVLIAIASLALTPNEHREVNGFTWEPILEVAKLFAGIFTCIIPVLAVLRAGPHGGFGWLLAAVTAGNGQPHNIAYFWLTGILSAFLDNAPTYLVFFELAGGDAHKLMGPLASTLGAISMGAVFMGALTYIGNAPNFMVYAIAIERGVKMPSFFGYILWSATFLLPVFVVLTFVAF
jgi:Na+/H+ antiporter NhaD/arsenite permease-like protein